LVGILKIAQHFQDAECGKFRAVISNIEDKHLAEMGRIKPLIDDAAGQARQL